MEYSTSLLQDNSIVDSLAIVHVNVHMLIVSFVVVVFMKILVSILEPMNYKLDMTSKKYCKPIAEIDNSLRLQRGTEGELHPVAVGSKSSNLPYELNKQQRSVDCATDLLNNNSNTEYNNEIDLAQQQQTGSTNHVYPNGWIPIMESFKVKPGKVKSAIIFGRDLIVTRSLDGNQVNVLDAYCPHMGVHIGIGGQVRQVDNESCVECPFHGWTFRSSDGQCVKIPYQKKSSNIPSQAKLGVWHSVELDNFIYVWHHIDNEPPNWFLTPSELLKLDNWTLIGRSVHRTNLELRDVLENGADMNHFEGIHNDLFILGSDFIRLRLLNYLQKYTRHHWLPEWKPVNNDETGRRTHKAEMKLQSWISFLNLRLFDITVRAIQTGPARVDLFYNSNWYGKGLLIMNAIPLGGRQTKYIQHIYTERTLFQCVMAKNVLYGEIKMLERDFFIWNHKKNIRNPIFISEDKILKQFRSWYSQFYRRKQKIFIQQQDDGDDIQQGGDGCDEKQHHKLHSNNNKSIDDDMLRGMVEF